MIHPSIRDLFAGLAKHPAFQEALHRLRERPGAVGLSGLNHTAKAVYSVLLWQLTGQPLLLIVDGNQEAETLLEAIETFFDLLVTGRDPPRPQLLPALDVLPFQDLAPHAEILEQRAVGLLRLAGQNASITVAPIASALLRIEGAEFYRQLRLSLRAGDEVPLPDLIQHLESVGYQRREPVEMVGEFSVRGGIVDVFSPESAQPVRIELFGDQIESIRRFEVASQRSIAKIESCSLLPLTEYPKSADARGPRTASVFSLPENPLVVWDEPEQTRSAAERTWKRLEQNAPEGEAEAWFFRWEELEAQCAPLLNVAMRQLDLDADPALHIPARPSPAFHGNIQAAVSETRALVESGNRVVFFAASTGEVERVADVLNEYGIAYQLGLEQTPEYLAERAYFAGAVASTFVVKGAVRRGGFLADHRLAIFGYEDLFDRSELVAEPSKSHLATFSADLLDLKPGDFVVHAEHGVGCFLGLREIPQGDNKGDFMLIEYAGASKLYVPLARMDLVQRFRGAGDGQPQLDRLGGVTWTKTKSKVKARMRDMAEELLKLYAARRMTEGFSFSLDSNWQREFEDAFEFAPTQDQITAVREIKRDMEAPQPMDRLLCGDVGFGKTEVVMRAAFKALGDGKQVAILAPTTVLCFQHFETFKRRFQPFPVRVEMFSRFRTAKELKALVEDLAAGKIDIAIGTHRLFSKDIEFKDLGLVIVDEEQRFGVAHKERLKHLKKSVDVISMSATPIPRTLHMSLLGLRDMSVIETPPKDRLAIQTTVAHFSPQIIKEAVELELARGGQVYMLHNRVDSIWARAAMLQELAPQSRIGVGHGQMPEAELERVMLRFMKREYDVLVSTTIVENGLDIPLANTMIIENAERYGLSELYQLRGRVGRSNRRAYAYLLVPPNTELTEVARKRLAALKEFSDLGAGFKIAALDLELRGAGNLLGGEQHGHINVVGFDMYVRMLEETVRELKGEEVPLEVHSALNLGVDVRIPSGYIPDENQRLRVYKRIAHSEELDSVAQELEDRYGPVPEAVRNLFAYSALKNMAEKLGIQTVDRRGSVVNIQFHAQTKVDPARLMQLVSHTRGAQFTPAGILRVPLDGLTAAGEILGFLSETVSRLLPG
ncbi:MAG: transcription-repair coupling factor [Acidobacteria bacterium]|nr:transcription-repair coupling factor [Acidobacteriota bacterium]